MAEESGSHSLKHAWSSIVNAEDYDGHMAEVGQAQANAELVRNFLSALQLPKGSRILFAGAGTGQMFDYVDASFLLDLVVTFTDINQEFLDVLSARATRVGMKKFTTVLDDVEETKLGEFDWIILVLVLEHVDWRKALKSLSVHVKFGFLIISQKNPEGMTTNVAPNRVLRPSIAEASKGEQAHLIADFDLIAELDSLGFDLDKREDRYVPDEKLMCAFQFRHR